MVDGIDCTKNTSLFRYECYLSYNFYNILFAHLRKCGNSKSFEEGVCQILIGQVIQVFFEHAFGFRHIHGIAEKFFYRLRAASKQRINENFGAAFTNGPVQVFIGGSTPVVPVDITVSFDGIQSIQSIVNIIVVFIEDIINAVNLMPVFAVIQRNKAFRNIIIIRRSPGSLNVEHFTALLIHAAL